MTIKSKTPRPIKITGIYAGSILTGRPSNQQGKHCWEAGRARLPLRLRLQQPTRRPEHPLAEKTVETEKAVKPEVTAEERIRQQEPLFRDRIPRTRQILDPKVVKITQVPKITEPIQTQNCAVKMAGVSDSTKETNVFVEPIASTNTFKVETVEAETVVRQAQVSGTREVTVKAVVTEETVKLQVTVATLVRAVKAGIIRGKARVTVEGVNPQVKVHHQSASSTYVGVAEVVKSAHSATQNLVLIFKRGSVRIRIADSRT